MIPRLRLNSRMLLAALPLGFALLSLSGCGHKKAGPTSNTFHIAMTASPTTFDPAMVQDGTTIDMLQQVFEGLVEWTTDNKLAPALASSWDVSKDGLTYTFHMRPGVKFQDGSPLTAQDVYDSMRRALDPKLKSQVAITYLGDIVGAKELNIGKTTQLSGVKVIDPQTVAITIVKPKAYWIYTLTYPTAYPISKAEVSSASGPGGTLTDTDVAKGAGTGPFQVSSYVKDSKVELKAYSSYWGGAPKLAGQERLVVTQSNTRHGLYISGQLDILQYVTPGDLDNDSKDATLKSQVQQFPRASTYYIGLNQKAFPAFKDVRVRQAFAYATDKQKIIQVVFAGQRDIAQDILPKGIPGYDPNFQGLPYDPAKAKQLLAQAGYPDGKNFPTIPIYCRDDDPNLPKTIDVIRQMWHDNLGVTVQSSPIDWGVLLDREDKNTLECYHIRWAADYLDPQDYYSVLLRTGSAEDHVSYSNPQYDKLCDAADVSQDAKARFALYRQAARIAADEVPMIPLYYQKDVELVKPYVHNIDDSLMGHLPYKNVTLSQ